MSQESSKKIAFFVSQATSPVLVVLVGLGIITYYYSTSLGQFFRWTMISFILLVGPGLLYTLINWYRYRKIDIDISKREDRIVPLLLSSMGAVIISFIVSTRLESPTLLLFSYIVVAMLIALTFTTLVWKISFHAATPAAAVTLLTLIRGPEYSWLYLGVIPVVWSRLVLKQHTSAQLAAGAFAGIAITFLAYLLFRP